MSAHARWHAHAGSPAPLRYLLKAHNDPSREVNQPPVASLQDIAATGLKVCLSYTHTHTCRRMRNKSRVQSETYSADAEFQACHESGCKYKVYTDS